MDHGDIGILLAHLGVFGSGELKSKYSKTCVKRPLNNRQDKALNDKW